MARDVVHTAGAPAPRPSDTGTEIAAGPLVAALLALTFTVSAVVLLFLYPHTAILVSAGIAMAIATVFFIGYIATLLNDRDAP
jgi:hypothetical protein